MKRFVITEDEKNHISKMYGLINEEQSTTNNIDYSQVEEFLTKINHINKPNMTSNWVLDPTNKNARGPVVKLANGGGWSLFANKPLVWSLVVDGKKDPDSIFEFFTANGKIYFHVTSSGNYHNTSYVELASHLKNAIDYYNERIIF